MTIRLHRGDLSQPIPAGSVVAIDTETFALKTHRERLCVFQLSTGDGTDDVIQIAPGQRSATNGQRGVIIVIDGENSPNAGKFDLYHSDFKLADALRYLTELYGLTTIVKPYAILLVPSSAK